MATIKKSTEIIQLREIGLLPEGLSRKPEFPQDLTLETNAQLGFSHLMGKQGDFSNLVQVSPEGGLRQVSYGNDYKELQTKSGTGTAAFNATDQILRTSATPKFDVFVETADATIRFNLIDGTDSDEIIVPVGFRSYEFMALGIQIKNRTGTNCAFSINAFY